MDLYEYVDLMVTDYGDLLVREQSRWGRFFKYIQRSRLIRREHARIGQNIDSFTRIVPFWKY
jgi:hypothetical protein